ncbi:MATE family efflux transporter [bacterium]|nr:MATE family efflux transporter [bacterium]
MNLPEVREIDHSPAGFAWALEVRQTLKLALPVIIAEIGWMAMGVADTLLVSHLGPEAIGATGIGGNVYFTFGIFGMGLMLGLDTLVSQAFGSGDTKAARHWLRTGLVMSIILTPLLMVAFAVFLLSIDRWGLNPEVGELAESYMNVVTWGTGPLLIYAAFRRFLQSVGSVRPVMAVILAANLINVFGNWVLINGKFGMPALGVVGSAWSTVISRTFLAAGLFNVVRISHTSTFDSGWWKSVSRSDLSNLFRLGFPAAAQITLEVGIFSLSGALVGRMSPISLAAHQIVLNISSLTFMIPLGIATAAAVRVGHAVGARERLAATRAGWSAIILAVGIMIALAITFVTIPETLVDIFTDDARIIAAGVSLLALAAVFQICDGLQAVTTGALRGLGDTRTPAVCNLVAHWLIGLPVGIWLAFSAKMEVRGIWIGLSTGLIVAGSVLLVAWTRASKRIRTAPCDSAAAA